MPLLTFCVSPVSAQPLHYDPYYILPGAAGGMGVDAGLATEDFEHLPDTGELYFLGKYSPTDRLEIGARLISGIFHDSEDPFHAFLVGAKWSLDPTSTATFGFLLPAGDIDDPGLSLGWMRTTAMGGTTLNYHFQLGFLEGYAGGEGALMSLLIEPVKVFEEQVTGYLDIRISTRTGGISHSLAIDLAPSLDYVVSEGTVINGGISLGLAGDAKQKDVGLFVTAIKAMEGR